METAIIIIALAAFAGSFLTFFSGFGLGTLLLPVYLFFFPPEIAILLTGLVHLLNNLLKAYLLRGSFDRTILIRFGGGSFAGAIAGVSLYKILPQFPPLFEYEFGAGCFHVFPFPFAIGCLMIFFAFFEQAGIRFKKGQYVTGGLVSGFFGGFTGHQGALRSAFLINSGLTKEVYISTGVFISLIVDFTRIPMYIGLGQSYFEGINWQYLVAGGLPAIFGAVVGNQYLKKSSYTFTRILVTVFLVVFGLLLILGIL
jgi:uncharacterized protein